MVPAFKSAVEPDSPWVLPVIELMILRIRMIDNGLLILIQPIHKGFIIRMNTFSDQSGRGDRTGRQLKV